MTTNVKLPKKGDKIFVKFFHNGTVAPDGILTVAGANPTGRYFSAKSESGHSWAVYSEDNWIYADRKEQKKFLQEKIDILEEEMATLKKELSFLQKYESEEDFVADKLDKILTAHKEGKTANNRRSAIADVLKELKESHLL